MTCVMRSNRIAPIVACAYNLMTAGSLVGAALTFDTNSVGTNDFADLTFKHRTFIPYGPDLTISPIQDSSELWEGYGYGLGAAEHWGLDSKEGYLYTQSEAGEYIAILDYGTTPATLTEYSLDFSGADSDVRDVAVCSSKGYLFVSLSDANTVRIYQTVKRNNPGTPQLLFELDAGGSPDALSINDECTMLAVANQNEGRQLASAGALTLISDFEANGGPTIRTVSLSGLDEADLLANNVHLPLTRNAMRYWNELSPIANDLIWDDLIDNNYDVALFLDPEFVVFNADSSEIYLNLQDNSALVRIDTSTGQVIRVDGYGLKEWTSGDGIDIVDDGGCDRFITDEFLYTTRAPDGIATVRVDGVDYVLTADEGSDLDFDDYEEKFDSDEVFMGGNLALPSFTADPALFVPGSSAEGASANFNSECESIGLEWCAAGFEMTIGSSAVNYNNYSAPVLERIVGIGGRGISIFRVPRSTSDPMEFVWDSGSDFEVEGCAAFPWAHSAVQDEEYAPVGGPYYELDEEAREDIEKLNDYPNGDGCADGGDGNPGVCPMSETVDAKALEDGLAPETVIVGVACDRLLAISCGENNSNCFVYDITDIRSPTLRKVINLTPASENKNPGVAYDDRTLGDLDAETQLFVNAEESPTGKAGVLFGGAISGTISFWEFECRNDVSAIPVTWLQTSQASGASNADEDDGLSGGAITGIVLGSLVGVLFIVAMVAKGFFGEGSKESDTGAPNRGGGDPGVHA